MAQNFSIEDLANLLKQTNKKPRKKIERTAEQEKAMKEKLALMREKSMANRQAKAASKPPPVVAQPVTIEPIIRTLEVQKLNEKDTDALFEKKYNSRFEKLDQTMEHVKLSLDEMREMKKQKVLERQKAKEEAKVIPEIKTNNSDPIPQIKPTTTQPVSIPINPNRVPKTPDYRNLFKR